jgi:hypothetical protein
MGDEVAEKLLPRQRRAWAQPISTLIQGEHTVKLTALFSLMFGCGAPVIRDVNQITFHFNPKFHVVPSA